MKKIELVKEWTLSDGSKWMWYLPNEDGVYIWGATIGDDTPHWYIPVGDDWGDDIYDEVVGWSCEFSEQRDRLIELLHEYGEEYGKEYADAVDIDEWADLSYDEIQKSLSNTNAPAWLSREDFEVFCHENAFENEDAGDEYGLWGLWIEEAGASATDAFVACVQAGE